jgi:hypothetical protein
MTRTSWRIVAALLEHDFDGEMREMGSGELVTEGHRIRFENDWRPAGDLFPVKVNYKGRVYNLGAQSQGRKSGQCYTLSNGRIAHNFLEAMSLIKRKS